MFTKVKSLIRTVLEKFIKYVKQCLGGQNAEEEEETPHPGRRQRRQRRRRQRRRQQAVQRRNLWIRETAMKIAKELLKATWVVVKFGLKALCWLLSVASSAALDALSSSSGSRSIEYNSSPVVHLGSLGGQLSSQFNGGNLAPGNYVLVRVGA